MEMTLSKMQKLGAIAAFAATASVLQGCGYIPKDGPTRQEVHASAEVHLEEGSRLSYAFVKLSPLVLSNIQTERQRPVLFSRLAKLVPPATVRVSPSDTISVSIFEATAGGLFIPAEAGSRPGNFVQIPTQEVDQNGNITIPYVGAVRALGRTKREIEDEIVSKLKERAIEPQAIVTVGERAANVVTVLGDVKSPVTIPMRPGGLRLLTALARAGGTSAAAHSTIVTVRRRGKTEQALLTSILQDPASNIELAPEDVIYVSAEPRVYMVFGATSVPGTVSFGTGGVSFGSGRRFPIDRENVTLTEALATSGGLLPQTADPRGIFVFRYTPREVLKEAGVDVSAIASPSVPTVFSVDLGNAEGYFLANHFFLKHNDIIYVAESPSVDLAKFLTVINNVNTTASGLLGTVQQVRSQAGL